MGGTGSVHSTTVVSSRKAPRDVGRRDLRDRPPVAASGARPLRLGRSRPVDLRGAKARRYVEIRCLEVPMGIVIFGHGGLDPIATKDMEWVAVPAGTTLQFYADAGQTLLTNAGTWERWSASMDAPWPAIDSTGVTYNLRLGPLSAQEQKEIDGLTDFP